jgi:hypothetical protein
MTVSPDKRSEWGRGQRPGFQSNQNMNAGC